MSGEEVCESGLWVDADGSVVDHQTTGVQLVPPGGTLRPDRIAAIERAKAAAPAEVVASVSDPEPAEPKKVPAAKKAAPKGKG